MVEAWVVFLGGEKVGGKLGDYSTRRKVLMNDLMKEDGIAAGVVK